MIYLLVLMTSRFANDVSHTYLEIIPLWKIVIFIVIDKCSQVPASPVHHINGVTVLDHYFENSNYRPRNRKTSTKMCPYKMKTTEMTRDFTAADAGAWGLEKVAVRK